MSLIEIFQRSISRADVVRVRNALNPLLWLSAVGPTPSWAMAYLLRDDLFLRDALVLLGALPILGTLIAYFIWMFRDPDRLQSEEFIIKQHELSLLERKGNAPPILSTDADTLTEAPPDGLKGISSGGR